MQEKIIAAIAAYLETRIYFGYRIDRKDAEKLAEDIYAAAIAPLVEAGEPEWKDAPEWAEWHVTTEFMGEVKNTWYENLQVAARTRQVGTKSDIRKHLNWGHVIGTIYRRPK